MRTADALNLIAGGDRTAFTSLYARAQPELVRYAAALLAGDVDAALDVVDEAFLNIWRDAGRYSGAGNADGWIRRIVRNKAIDWLRTRRERPFGADGEAERLVDPAEAPDHAAERNSAARELRRALEKLSPEHREVVWLCYFEDRSLAEIAAIAGCPENTVKTRLFHARRLLRQRLSSFSAEPSEPCPAD
jgi:RNA polymerase sigma-70 factor (ECF subfamily)